MTETEAKDRIVMLVSIAEEYVGGEGYKEMDDAGVEAIKATVKEKMELFGSVGKA